ncbi:hypothetical protein TIFTF001_003835 [Ficus carica]|uniref:Uncharacterized protein n=1 Tax=Ficus carica TaxID=3494 RepID=A0AA88CS78_FICCA|nr:hypothetical protein TIFTF001_003835 [Ficus carica]
MTVACVEICHGSMIRARRSRDWSVSHCGVLLLDAVNVKIWSMVTDFCHRHGSLFAERERGERDMGGV